VIPAALSWRKWQITCTHATRSGRSSPCKLHCRSGALFPPSCPCRRPGDLAVGAEPRTGRSIKSYYSSALLLLLAMDACLIWGDGRKVRLERNGAVAAAGSCLAGGPPRIPSCARGRGSMSTHGESRLERGLSSRARARRRMGGGFVSRSLIGDHPALRPAQS
jgi:hypothetical protein